MGTSSFAVPTLRMLIENDFELTAVYTQPPRPAGRGKKTKIGPVGQFANEKSIKVVYPKNFTNSTDIDFFKRLEPDLVIVVAYGLLLPEQLLRTAKIGFFNIHASLLPRWRGAAPIERAILSGDRETGVCLISLEPSLDTGPIIYERRVEILETDNAGSLYERLSLIGATLTKKLCKSHNALSYNNQKTQGITYAKKIEKSETRINWNVSAQSLDLQIRAFSPNLGAWFELEGERIKILKAQVSDGVGLPGHIIDNYFQVACKKGSIFPLVLQRPGRLPLAAEDFLRGYKVSVGMVLS